MITDVTKEKDLEMLQLMARDECRANGLLVAGDIDIAGEIPAYCASEMALAVENKELFLQWAEIIWKTFR